MGKLRFYKFEHLATDVDPYDWGQRHKAESDRKTVSFLNKHINASDDPIQSTNSTGGETKTGPFRDFYVIPGSECATYDESYHQKHDHLKLFAQKVDRHDFAIYKVPYLTLSPTNDDIDNGMGRATVWQSNVVSILPTSINNVLDYCQKIFNADQENNDEYEAGGRRDLIKKNENYKKIVNLSLLDSRFDKTVGVNIEHTTKFFRPTDSSGDEKFFNLRKPTEYTSFLSDAIGKGEQDRLFDTTDDRWRDASLPTHRSRITIRGSRLLQPDLDVEYSKYYPCISNEAPGETSVNESSSPSRSSSWLSKLFSSGSK
ncbi:uncharacterized protein L199_003641 [Kwoniella botswanensis]|uniref:uncharacterized protein n=1 Tax=Kwoniella botswanensis TaxID=1268659 RepID=UPI00315D3C4B